jgi:hypothetical protein
MHVKVGRTAAKARSYTAPHLFSGDAERNRSSAVSMGWSGP